MRPPSVFPALLCLLVACAGSAPDVDPEPSEADRQRFIRRRLEDGRALVAEGRLDAAERHLRRGLQIGPDDPKLHRELARVLEDLDRPDEARRQRALADRIDPATPLPSLPRASASEGLVVLLVPPEQRPELLQRLPDDWPNGPVASILRDRLRVRLPGARVVQADPETVAEAQRLLTRYAPRAVASLRVDRSYCGSSLKDGPFALAWLRVAAAVPARPAPPPESRRSTVLDPDPAEDCVARAVGLALESALAGPALDLALRAAQAADAPAQPAAHAKVNTSWPRTAVRALFPGIGARIVVEIEAGRRELASGMIAVAAETFQRAVHIDPGDPFARTYLSEAEATLAIVRELDAERTGGQETASTPTLDPRLSPGQVAAVERRLAEERRRRDELLAALAVLDEDAEIPVQRLRDSLRPTRISAPHAFGPRLARELSGGDVSARAVYAPDGSILARYYFPEDGDTPIVREEDSDGDGTADRWIGYQGTHRAEIYEDERGEGLPNLHFIFAADGTRLERIEIDENRDGKPERIFRYRRGVVVGEDRDTTGDGRIDRLDEFDDIGQIAQRSEDLDGDGEIDIRSHYRDGKLVRRAIENPDLVQEGRLLGRDPKREP